MQRATPTADPGPTTGRATTTGRGAHRAPRLAAAAVALAVLLAACGGGADDDGSSRRPDRGADRTTRPAPTTPRAAAAASPGCGHPAGAPVVGDDLPGDVARTITIGGAERAYRLGVPPGYDPDRPAPLVLNLHGSGSDAVQAGLYGRVPQEGAERGMIVVAPDAIDGRWQLAPGGADRDFLVALVDDLGARYCVDPDRVHLIGMSLGAWKAAVTGCTVPDTFASAALVTVEVHPDGCPPLPVVAFHGTADATVPYGEGSGHEFPDSPNAALPGTHDNIVRWAKGNGCDPEPAVERIGDDVERWTYRGCTADVVLYTIFGGGHTWPGARIRIGPTTGTIDATEIAFDWFEAHPRAR